MTNDPEIRAAVLKLYGAHVELLRVAADMVEALPVAAVVDGPYMRLAHALDAETLCLRALAPYIEPPNARAELYRTIAESLEGKR